MIVDRRVDDERGSNRNKGFDLQRTGISWLSPVAMDFGQLAGVENGEINSWSQYFDRAFLSKKKNVSSVFEIFNVILVPNSCEIYQYLTLKIESLLVFFFFFRMTKVNKT